MLYLFDLDGTLITSYMDAADKNYHVWNLLPGRLARLAALIEDGHWVGVVTNQAGVAWGKIAESDVRQKLHQVAANLECEGVTIYDGGVPHATSDGELPVWVCYDDAKANDARYRRGAGRRKPSGAMIREAMDDCAGPAAQGVLYVGDRPEDAEAARDAGVAFEWAESFFGG